MAVRRSTPTHGLGIGARFALAVGGGVAGMLFLYAAVVLASAGSSLEEKIDALGVQASRALAAPGPGGWLMEGEDGKPVARRGTRKGIENVIGDRRYVLSAYIQDEKGVPRVRHYKGEFRPAAGGGSFGRTKVAHGTYTSGNFTWPARLYQTPLLDRKGHAAGTANVIVAEAVISDALARLRTNILLISVLVIALTVGVTIGMASLVTSPLRALVQAVSRINRGNLHYRSTTRSRDEVGQLAVAIEEMCVGLREGEQAWERLDAAQEEARLLGELQTALLPRTLPEVGGFEVDAAHLGGTESGADIYDAVPLQDGRLALIVASTSRRGALGALLAAMTRAYLRGYLEDSGNADRALKATNRNLAQGMRQGLHVTCQVAVLDPKGSRATVFIAGHRAPFYACRGGEISVVHGEGLALGLDRGEVFDRRLEEVVVEMPPGTRIVLTTVGTYEFEGASRQRFGVDRFQELVRKHAPKNSDAFLNLVLGALEAHLGDGERASDATLVTAKRMV